MSHMDETVEPLNDNQRFIAAMREIAYSDGPSLSVERCALRRLFEAFDAEMGR